MTKDEAHAAQQRNFHRNLKSSVEGVKWFVQGLGGDGRSDEAANLWYAKYPEKDPRKALALEPDECPDKDCKPCYGPWVDY